MTIDADTEPTVFVLVTQLGKESVLQMTQTEAAWLRDTLNSLMDEADD